MKFELAIRERAQLSKVRQFTVIPAKRSASRNPARFGISHCVSDKNGLDSRLRGNDVFKL